MDHKNLEAWKYSMNLVQVVYEETKKFPNDEMFGLISQIRRSAVSVPSNIAEGCARKGNAETIQFLYIALGSLAELETQILIAKKLCYAKNEQILDSIESCRKMII